MKEEDQCQPEIHRKFINIAQGIHLRKWIHGDYEFFTVVLSGGGNWFTEQQEALSDLEVLNDWSSSGEKTRLWCEWAAENARHDSSAFELDFRGECEVFPTQFYVLTIYLAPKPTHVTLGKKQKDLLITMKSEPTDTAWMLKFPSPGGTFWCSFKWLYYRFGRNSAVPWKTLGNYYRAFYDADDVEEIIMMWCSWRRKLGRCDSPQRRTITRTRSFFGEFNCVLSCAFIYPSISLFLQKLNTVCLSVCLSVSPCPFGLDEETGEYGFVILYPPPNDCYYFTTETATMIPTEWNFYKGTMGDGCCSFGAAADRWRPFNVLETGNRDDNGSANNKDHHFVTIEPIVVHKVKGNSLNVC